MLILTLFVPATLMITGLEKATRLSLQHINLAPGR